MYYTPSTSLKDAEKKFSLKIDKPFFASDGLSIETKNGYESPQVIVRTVDGTEILLNEHSIGAFARAFDKARYWCMFGWTDGMR